MATASSMILSALVYTGEKQIGDTLTAGEQTHYLSRLNAMLDSWSIDRLFCYQILQESFALTTGTGTYTIGSGGAFNTGRPNRITYGFIRDSANMDSALKILSYESYDRLALKSTGNTYPEYLFYDTAFVTSLGTIRLYPLPSAALTLFIDSWKALQSFAAITDTVVLPPGYQRAIESNFAIESAAGFTQTSPELQKIAQESKAAIKKLNVPNPVMRLDIGVVKGGHMSILTGP